MYVIKKNKKHNISNTKQPYTDTNSMSEFVYGLWALSVSANIIISFPVLFDSDIEYPHGRGEVVYEYSMGKRHMGLILGLMGVPLCIFLNK